MRPSIWNATFFRKPAAIRIRSSLPMAGTCLVRFGNNKKFSVTQIPLPAARIAELQDHMLLMYTGIERDSFSVLKGQVERTASNHDALCRMSKLAE